MRGPLSVFWLLCCGLAVPLLLARTWPAPLRVRAPAAAAGAPPLHFDPARCGPGIALEEGNTVARKVHGAYAAVLANRSAASFAVRRLDGLRTAHFYLGVAPAGYAVDSQPDPAGHSSGFWYHGSGTLAGSRPKSFVYGPSMTSVAQHDEVRVHFDAAAGTLSFALNGEDLGVAFENVPAGLLPAVHFSNSDGDDEGVAFAIVP